MKQGDCIKMAVLVIIPPSALKWIQYWLEGEREKRGITEAYRSNCNTDTAVDGNMSVSGQNVSTCTEYEHQRNQMTS